MVVRRTCNAKVGGSIPSEGKLCWPSLLRHRANNARITGFEPVQSTICLPEDLLRRGAHKKVFGLSITNTILKNANNPPVSLSRLEDYLRFKRIILGVVFFALRGCQLDDKAYFDPDC